jgi:hypothetical protein
LLERIAKWKKGGMKEKDKVQLNLYFGEERMNDWAPVSPKNLKFKKWGPHPNRYLNWKWKKK